MTTLFIFYDLEKPQNREALIQKIKSYGKWARLGNNAYMIATDKEPVTVRNDLSKVLTSGDRIFVGIAAAPSAWRGLPEAVAKWILANQE